MKKYHVYTGCFELYITTHELEKPFILLQSFDNLQESIYYCNAIEDRWYVTCELEKELTQIYTCVLPEFITEHITEI